MHKIDPSNPSRQFYFSIVVVNDKYTGEKLVCLANTCILRNQVSERLKLTYA